MEINEEQKEIIDSIFKDAADILFGNGEISPVFFLKLEKSMEMYPISMRSNEDFRKVVIAMNAEIIPRKKPKYIVFAAECAVRIEGDKGDKASEKDKRKMKELGITDYTSGEAFMITLITPDGKFNVFAKKILRASDNSPYMDNELIDMEVMNKDDQGIFINSWDD